MIFKILTISICIVKSNGIDELDNVDIEEGCDWTDWVNSDSPINSDQFSEIDGILNIKDNRV